MTSATTPCLQTPVPEDLSKLLYKSKTLFQINSDFFQKIAKQFQVEIAAGKKIVAVEVTNQEPGFAFVYDYFTHQKPSQDLSRQNVKEYPPSLVRVLKEQVPASPSPFAGSAEINQKTGYASSSGPAASASATGLIQVLSKPLVLPKLVQMPSIAFGKDKWKQHFGDIGKEPPLPENVCEILNSPCPFIKGKKREETHLLVLVPATLNGQPMTLNRLGTIMHTHDSRLNKRGYQYNIPNGHGDTPFESSHWVMMTKDVIEGSRNKSYAKQHAIVACYSPYQISMLSEAATCIYMHYVVTGQRLYADKPLTFTRCQDKYQECQLVIGSFASDGLDVVCIPHEHAPIGVAGLWKF